MTDGTAPPSRAAMLNLLGAMAQRTAEVGISPVAAGRFVDGVAELCSPDDTTAAACLEELSKLEEGSQSWNVVYRRHVLLPLLYFDFLGCRYTPAELRDLDLSGGREGLWLSGLSPALGESRTRQIMLATHVGHRRRVEVDWRHALFLIRNSARWLEVHWVRERLIAVVDRMQRGTATDEEKAQYELMTEPLIVDGTTRLRKRRGGKRSTSPRDIYLSERRHEAGLETLIQECTALFGSEDRKPSSIERQLRAFKRDSPVWVEVPPTFYQTTLGRCLRPLAPPSFSNAPHVGEKTRGAGSRTGCRR